jgi:hypothetical protein
MPSADEALFWLPTAAVAAVALLAFIVAVAQPPRRAKAFWIVVTLLFGGAAVAGTLWHQTQRQDEGRAAAARLGEEIRRLRELGRHIDAVGQQLPAAGGQGSPENFDGFDAALDTLNAKLDALGPRIEALREKTRNREIDPQTAAKLTEYLRQFGSNRVVVSCVPSDVEAFGYATQIAGVLRAAGWEALGPEETKIFGDAQGMEVTLYVKAGVKPAESVRILLDAFARFNIPHKSGIAASDAIPDPATVELFVGRKG